MELGISSFGDLSPVEQGWSENGHRRMQELMEEIELADQLSLEVYAVGEHHRPDYLVSAPAVVLAAAAAKTKRIRLSSAVSILSSDDPVRVFQQFATVDLLSSGRAELMVGRGSFIESFPLFGYRLEDYDELFEEKLHLLLEINKQVKVSWKGKHRPDIPNLGIYPRPFAEKLPVWIAAGGTPQSAIRAGSLGLPLTLAIIGGQPVQFVPFIDLYRKAWDQHGHPLKSFQLGINSHTYVAETSQQAADEFFPSYAEVMSRIGRERGWGPTTRGQYEAMRSPRGALLVGSPQQVIDKILYEHELFGNTRFMAQMSIGTIEHKKVMRSIELFGTVVAPEVRKVVSQLVS
jgi:probable LLM family oxidoreductase